MENICFYGRGNWNRGFPGGSMAKTLPANAGDAGSILGSVRSPEEGSSNALQFSCMGNPMGTGAWWATLCGVTKSCTWLCDQACTCLKQRPLNGFLKNTQYTNVSRRLYSLWFRLEKFGSTPSSQSYLLSLEVDIQGLEIVRILPSWGAIHMIWRTLTKVLKYKTSKRWNHKKAV